MAKGYWKRDYVTLSTGNAKLIDTIIWNLPARATCIEKTHLCSKYCYAMKFQRMYKEVKSCRAWNMIASLRDDFVDVLSGLLADKLTKARKTYRFFRIHESGDFYSQEYVDQWTEIASRFPSLTFLAYTKSASLDFSKLMALPNVRIFYSVWEDSTAVGIDDALEQRMNLAYMDGTQFLAQNSKATFVCKPHSKCDKCRVCFHGKLNVVFSLH